MERLILARHGETDWNTRGLVNGDPAAGVRLTERGREEARRLGEELVGEPLDLCVVTPFPRTQETAGIALAARARRLAGARPRAEVPALPAPEREDARRLAGARPGAEVPALPAPEREDARRLAGARRRAEVPALPAPERGDVPRIVLPELGDPDYGRWEGLALEDYRAWASGSPSSAVPDGGGESRLSVVTRYALGFRALLARPERTILAVLHSLPVAYAVAARDGSPPPPRVPLVANAHAYPFTRAEVEGVVRLLEGWCAAPTW